MRTTVRVSGRYEATPATLFACLADYRVAPLFIDGLERLSPVTDVTSGEGARFDAVMRVGPKRFQSTIEIVDYDPDHLVTWASSSGQQQHLTFKLVPDGDAETTKVLLEVSYEGPSGLPGILFAPVVEETVRAHAHGALRKLRRHVA